MFFQTLNIWPAGPRSAGRGDLRVSTPGAPASRATSLCTSRKNRIEDLRVNLAISLHATTNETRDRLMPVNRGFPIEALLAACKRFPLPMRQRMTFEYVLLDGVNDSPQEANRLLKLLKGIRAKVNLIPFNDWEGSDFARPPLARILSFQAILLENGITATVRWSKGEDIGAACGQLNERVAG